MGAMTYRFKFSPMEGVSNLFSLAIRGDSVFHSNLSLVPSLKAKCESLPSFYSEVIELWEKFFSPVVLSNCSLD